MSRGLFITLEGIEGAGKSTAVPFIANYLQQHGVDLVITREPGGTEVAEKIRNVMLNHHGEPMCKKTELLLAFAGRAQHLERLIIPSLQAGKWVLCDRFTDSTYAYQGAGRGIAAEKVAIIEQWVQEGMQPDLTIIFDITPELGMVRISNKKARSLDRIEVEEMEFFRRVRDCYLQRAKADPKRFRVIDAAQNQSDVLKQVEKVLNQLKI